MGDTSHGLNSLKGGFWGTVIAAMKGDAGSWTIGIVDIKVYENGSTLSGCFCRFWMADYLGCDYPPKSCG